MKKLYQSVNKSIDIESSTKHTNLIKINSKALRSLKHLFLLLRQKVDVDVEISNYKTESKAADHHRNASHDDIH